MCTAVIVRNHACKQDSPGERLLETTLPREGKFASKTLDCRLNSDLLDPFTTDAGEETFDQLVFVFKDGNLVFTYNNC